MLQESSGERASLTVTAHNKIPDIWKQSLLYLWAVIAYDNCCNLWWMCLSAVWYACTCMQEYVLGFFPSVGLFCGGQLCIGCLCVCICKHLLLWVCTSWLNGFNNFLLKWLSYWSTVELITLIVGNAAAVNMLWIVSFLPCLCCTVLWCYQPSAWSKLCPKREEDVFLNRPVLKLLVLSSEKVKTLASLPPLKY